MISLDIENYCHNCPKFEPECEKLYADNSVCETIIQCTNKGLCMNLKQHIQQEIVKKARRL